MRGWNAAARKKRQSGLTIATEGLTCVYRPRCKDGQLPLTIVKCLFGRGRRRRLPVSCHVPTPLAREEVDTRSGSEGEHRGHQLDRTARSYKYCRPPSLRWRSPTYCVDMPASYVLRAAPDVVELWSTVRLPYEPRDWVLKMRNDLRRALRASAPRSGGRLHAVYRAADDGELVDTENVLLYNVGSGALRPLVARSVTFERGYEIPAPPAGSGLTEGAALHYQCYREARDDTFEFWGPGKQLAAFTDVPVHSVDDKPAPVWKAIRDFAAPPTETASAPTRFVLRLHVTDTRETKPANSLVYIVKPTLDGIISAYHSHEGSDGVVEAQRLEEAGLGARETLRDQLLDPRWAALGGRRLLSSFGRAGVQWNPADDLCVAVHITLSADGSVANGHNARWRLSAELAEAIPVPVPRRLVEQIP